MVLKRDVTCHVSINPTGILAIIGFAHSRLSVLYDPDGGKDRISRVISLASSIHTEQFFRVRTLLSINVA